MIDHTCQRYAVERRQFGAGPYTLVSVLSFIFDHFYRVRNDDVRDIEGNGLGLAIVKSTIEQHGGHISVESEPGKVTCFTFTLPLAKEK